MKSNRMLRNFEPYFPRKSSSLVLSGPCEMKKSSQLSITDPSKYTERQKKLITFVLVKFYHSLILQEKTLHCKYVHKQSVIH